MRSFALTARYPFARTVDRVVAVNDSIVVAQLEENLVRVDLDRREAQVLPPIEPGSTLLAVTANGERTCFDNGGNIVLSQADGALTKTLALGPDAEFVDARVVGDALAVLIGESVGEPMGLGVPRFSFVTLDAKGNPARLPHARGGARPRHWTVDRSGNCVIAFYWGLRPVAVNLASGVAADAPIGFNAESRRYEVAGAAVRGDGLLLKTLWAPEDRRGELRISALAERRSRVVAIFGRSDGPIRTPLWSADGLAVACQAGSDAQPSVLVVQAGPDPQWQVDRPTQMEPGGVLVWCGRRLIVQLAETELGVIELK